ncbi:CobW family GTP-binding protein [Methylocella tundrae]|uniref:GTP-binding protein n=1 Tax=Methylocella tundrae TaxID=227605 RepID=A0A4U8Z5Q9_METTU|nr:GTP-binding protein [Methylocella tundrae]WPP04472.1 GTP-binding protein [Methylocella tundrae]VFU10860.1 GTP-binding protein [Methylocella tundrae]
MNEPSVMTSGAPGSSAGQDVAQRSANHAGPEARRPPAPFPLTVITGFLGAGKTTLLNRLLRDPALSDTLVIINEFGEIGLDHLLVEQAGDDMLVMTSGCVCCSIRGDLITTLEDVLRRRDNGRITPFKRVIIETTGLADPAPVLHTIMYHPYLMLRFRLDGVVTLIDAVNGAATLDAHEEAVKQAAMADRLVIAKTDLLEGETGARASADLRARLSRLNPGARVIDAAKGEATAAALLDAGLYDPERKTLEVRRWLNAEAFSPRSEGAAAHHHDDDGEHHHHDHGGHEPRDVNRHDARIRAFCMRSDAPIAPAAFDLFLELLRNAHGPSLLRVKGIVALDDDLSRPVVIHGVQHVFHPPARLPAWPDDDHTTRIVFILRDMDPAFVEGMWKAFAGVPDLDRADAAALENNPLAPTKIGLLA